MKETIKDASGRTVGYKVKCGSQTIVQDASGATRGRYDENTGQTYDKSGRACFKGDHTDMLLNDDESAD
jgi:hypothetical protein